MISTLLTEAESLHFPFAEGPGIWPRVYVLHPLSRLLSPSHNLSLLHEPHFFSSFNIIHISSTSQESI